MKEYVATIELEGAISVANYESMDLEAAREVAECIARHMSSKAKVRNVEEDDEVKHTKTLPKSFEVSQGRVNRGGSY